MATQNMVTKKPLGEPKQYKNMGHGPLPLDAPSYGSMSIPGKGRIWLWPQDLVQRSVRHALSQGVLMEWDDGTKAPLEPNIPMPPAPSSVLLRRQRRIKIEESGHPRNPRRRTEKIADVLEEDAGIVIGRPTAPAAVTSHSGAELEKVAAAAQSAKTVEEPASTESAADEESWKKEVGSGSGAQRAPRARGSSFKKNDRVTDEDMKRARG